MREAARAPSVHNVQPARWRFGTAGTVTLFRALDRVLPVADPTGHDVAVSLGAAFEGMAIALSRVGLTLGAPAPERDARADGCEPVVRATITPGGEPDPLAPWVHVATIRRAQIFPDIPAAIAAMPADPNIIWCTGPSKTADVEGILIEGVHGPGVQVALLLA